MANRSRRYEDGEDSPSYSRLYVICGRSTTTDVIREAFSSFGEIEDIRMPTDHSSGQSKGVAFVKYSKTSEAAAALEALHDTYLPSASRTIRVMVATNRSDIVSRDKTDDEKYRRLFLHIGKDCDENQLENDLKQFGHIEDIHVQRDRNTGQSKGFAYVKFRKFSQTAAAFENCDKKYRAIFALPKGNKHHETVYESNLNTLAMSSQVSSSLVTMMNTQPQGYTKVHFICAPFLKQHHIEWLFDLVPGMTNYTFFVDLVGNFGKGTIAYSNPISAAYAVQKLNEFEYPPGVKIYVKPDFKKFENHEKEYNSIPKAIEKLKTAVDFASNNTKPDLALLAEAIGEASKIMKAVTGMSEDNAEGSNDLSYCSVNLPPPQPLANIDSVCVKRCFLVCKPQPPPLKALKDVFCRFGNLINVYTLPMKIVGYALYASAESADQAIQTLHGAEVCGVRMKVLEAEAEQPPRKVRKFE